MRLQIIGLTLFVTVSAALAAQERVLQLFLSPEPDRQFETVLYLAVGVGLTRSGLSSGRIDELPAAGEQGVEPDEVLSRALEEDSEYVLLVEYRRENGTAALALSLYEDDPASPLAGRHISLPVDINFDSRLTETVRDMVEEAGIAGDPTTHAVLEGVVPTFILPPPDYPQATPGAPAPPAGATPDNGAAGSAPPTAARQQISGLESSLAASGLLLIGEATKFFRYGISSALSAGFTAERDIISFSVGARASVIRVFKVEEVLGGELYLTTVGVDLHLGTPTTTPNRIDARLSGGAAAVTVVHSDTTLTKAVPYADAGLSARVPLGERFWFGGELRFIMVFEAGFPLMGLAPALMLSVEP